MSVSYKLVQWTPHKKAYDLVVAGAVLAYIAVFFAVGKLLFIGKHAISDEILLMRALGTCAIILLHVILCAGPLCRLDRRFLPILFNRRHLGVTMFLVSLAHGMLAMGYYHAFGVTMPLTSLLTANTQYGSTRAFPFESLGIVALVILFLMAATSHDFWLKNLTPRVWKALHMLVYVAYALLMMHVVLGVLQSERSNVLALLMTVGVSVVMTLHILAGRIEMRKEGATAAHACGHDWVDVVGVDEIPDGRAKVVSLPSRERIAVFKHDGKISALSNVCAHQNGPLGEGKIVGGCVTCPWHGYQYRPHDGCSPPPFTEKVPTYQVRVVGVRVEINPNALPAGTPVTPAVIADAPSDREARLPSDEPSPPIVDDEFYVGYLPMPRGLRRWTRCVVILCAALLLASAGTIAYSMRDPGTGDWNTDDLVTIEGIYRASPYPHIGARSPDGLAVRVLLVEEGKHGGRALTKEWDGERVTARGHTIRRANLTILELSPEASALTRDDKPAATQPEHMPLTLSRRTTLRGEILDPKCFAGAMKPGDGKAHKGCAVLCLRGGIPPVLAVWDSPSAAPTLYLLADARGGAIAGETLRAIEPYVADSVELCGVVEPHDNLPVLRVDIASIHRAD